MPLLEAMMFNVPIVAFGTTAIPSTMGNGGLVLENKNPVLVARAIDEIINNKSLREYIQEQQKLQLKKYERNVLEGQFLAKIKEIIEGNK